MAELLKNLYNKEYITLLSSELKSSFPAFEEEKFIDSVFDGMWNDKELKERMRHISTTINSNMPDNYAQSINILKNTFSKMNYSFSLENMLFQDYVEVFGLNEFEISMTALECFTINSSSEFAIRQFILKYPHATMEQMKTWAKSDNHHVRRLASEGCRPRLPWAIALKEFKKEPSEVLKIIDILKDDESEYVRKSVANNINDISKDNPHAVKKLAKEWIGKSTSRDWILKHGCRTLLKQSDKESLELFGFTKPNEIQLKDFHMPKSVNMGENLEFSFSLNSKKGLGKLRIEFVLHLLRQNNKLNKKVFKLAEGDYKESSKEFSKMYSFKPISTRKYYSGKHKLSILINGVEFIEKEFILS
ncbi:DNA alkylation repair protein [Sulfurimonas sp.]